MDTNDTDLTGEALQTRAREIAAGLSVRMRSALQTCDGMRLTYHGERTYDALVRRGLLVGGKRTDLGRAVAAVLAEGEVRRG